MLNYGLPLKFLNATECRFSLLAVSNRLKKGRQNKNVANHHEMEVKKNTENVLIFFGNYVTAAWGLAIKILHIP